MPPTMSDIPRDPVGEPTITIYGPHECPNCENAIGLFTRKGVAYTKVDLVPGDENHTYVTKTLGYTTAPVIVVSIPTETGTKTVHWGGPRNDMLMATVRMIAKLRAA